jgi:hypothetical protein
MRLQSPLSVVTPTLDGDVLRILAGADAEFTVPQLVSLIDGRSETGIRKTLVRLRIEGIVDEHVIGRSRGYRLNRDHLAAPAIIELAHLREGLIVGARERITHWGTAPFYAAIFGSAARGQMRTDSDIDLFIVRPNSDDHPDFDDVNVRELALWITRATGNDTRPLLFNEEELGRHGTDDPVLRDVSAEGIRLAGDRDAFRTAIRRPR